MKPTPSPAFHKVFSSHMVLQREKPIVFSGVAAPGSRLSLCFAGLTRRCSADAAGEWQAEFPAMAAGPCSDAVLTDGQTTVTLTDLLIGDVWFCSGQSNMEMPVYCGQQFYQASDPEAILADSDIPNLRLINVNEKQGATRRPAPDGPAAETTAPGWTRSTRESVADHFSCLAFLFGRQLHRETGVPVGLINASWGGTNIQAWIPRSKYEEENSRAELDVLEGKTPKDAVYTSGRKMVADWIENVFYAYGRKIQPVDAGRWAELDYDDACWDKVSLTFDLSRPFVIPLPGVHGFRFHLDLPASFQGQDLTLDLGVANDVDVTSFNGEVIGSTGIEEPAYWNINRVYTIPARLVKAGHNVLYVKLENHFGVGSLTLSGGHGKICPVHAPELALPLDGDVRHATMFDAPSQLVGYRPPVDAAEADTSAESPNYPCTMFNGLAAPFFKLAVKGILWYQGCNNNGDSGYYPLHKMLIESWRELWHDPSLPFLLVQLAGFEVHTPETPLAKDYWKPYPPLKDYPYALTREIQAEMTHRFANVGMAVAMADGEASDIHPHDKTRVAFQLVREAERIAYGMPVVSQGPEFHHFEVEDGGRVRLYFTHAENGLKTGDGEAPGALALYDRSGKAVWCQGVIEGSTVVVSSPEIPEPAAVRYAYCQYRGDINLMNEEGFPCVPFRSDKPVQNYR